MHLKPQRFLHPYVKTSLFILANVGILNVSSVERNCHFSDSNITTVTELFPFITSPSISVNVVFYAV